MSDSKAITPKVIWRPAETPKLSPVPNHRPQRRR